MRTETRDLHLGVDADLEKRSGIRIVARKAKMYRTAKAVDPYLEIGIEDGIAPIPVMRRLIAKNPTAKRIRYDHVTGPLSNPMTMQFFWDRRNPDTVEYLANSKPMEPLTI